MSKRYTLELINEKTISLTPDQTILQATRLSGIDHFHACGGQAKCSTCRVLVVQGGQLLTQPTPAERALAAQKQYSPNIRLACQTRVSGSGVKIKRIIRDEVDAELYVKSDQPQLYQSVGQERQLALFFLDIRNFTGFIEENLTFDVVHIIRRLSYTFNDLIGRHGGKVIESAGDGFYAAFGWEQDLPDACSSAVAVAREINREMDRFNRDYMLPFFSTRLGVGMGIHCGNVIVGSMSFNASRSLSVMGFAVNIASRLENSTRRYNNNIIISEAVYKHLSGEQDWPVKIIRLKSLKQRIKVRLLGQPFAS